MENLLIGVGTAGLKDSGNPDILVVLLPYSCESSMLFTENYFKAGSVIYTEGIAKKRKKLRAILVNSGNANCGTGREGIEHARMMAEKVAQRLDLRYDEVAVFSTGIIGEPLPIDRVLNAIEGATSSLKEMDLKEAAEVISTTDSFPKYETRENTFGFAKGAGMINPSMATMLSFVFTRYDLEYEILHDVHKDVVDKSFNSITVDGCQSTNDASVLVSLGSKPLDIKALKEEAEGVFLSLAKKIVADGEGATRVIRITVKNATLKMKAKEIAKSVANSLLVKTAVYGRDPNWGRILAAAGSTEFPIDPFSVKIYMGNHLLYDGKPHPKAVKYAKKYLESVEEVDITVDLREGRETWTYYSSDIGYEYIKINAEYHT